jgi:Outer membrane protein beta-barrel domain
MQPPKVVVASSDRTERTMEKLVTAVAILAAVAGGPVLAQEEEPARRFQMRPYAGAFVPVGDQRDVLDDAVLVGMAVSYDVHPNLAVVGSFGWAASRGTAGATKAEDLDVLQYDVGVASQLPIETVSGVTLKPFVGVGVGARTYDYRDLDVDSETDVVGYVSLGASLEYREVSLGFALRDCFSEYDGIGTEETAATRNDLGVFASLGARF